jgi:lysophospholipase L1-like esterase
MSKGFPIDQIVARNWIIENEGDLFSISRAQMSNYTGSPLAATTYGTNFYQGFAVVNTGQTALLRSITVSSDGPCVFAAHVSKAGFTSGLVAYSDNFDQKAASRNQIIFGSNGGTETIFFGGTNGFDIYDGGGYYASFFATSTVQPIVTISVNASMYTSDANFAADKVYLAIGDSITWGSLGTEGGNTSRPNYADTHYTNRIANILRKESNFDLRVSRRGFGGSTSNRWYDYTQSGAMDRTLLKYYDSTKTKLLVTIGLGTNDAAVSNATTAVPSSTSSTFQTTYRTRMEKIISYIYAKCPNASIIVLGPPNTDLSDGGRGTNVPGYRVVAAQLVSEGIATGGAYVGKDLKYYDQSAGLTLNDTNYTEQGTNAHLHPRGDTGHAIIATGNVNGLGTTGLIQVVKTTNFYLNNI